MKAGVRLSGRALRLSEWAGLGFYGGQALNFVDECGRSAVSMCVCVCLCVCVCRQALEHPNAFELFHAIMKPSSPFCMRFCMTNPSCEFCKLCCLFLVQRSTLPAQIPPISKLVSYFTFCRGMHMYNFTPPPPSPRFTNKIEIPQFAQCRPLG